MLDKNKSLTHDCGCGCGSEGCDCGKRNRFFRGKRMKAEDFEIEQAYGIERRRIVNRSVIGSGVVNGFEMTKGKSKIGPGFALDSHGREIVLAHSAVLDPDHVFLMAPGTTGCRTLPLDQARPRGRYLLSVHYAERQFGEAHLRGDCGCDKPQHNYVCETAVFSLVEIHGPCPCGEEPCHRTCECAITDACGRPRQPERDDDPKYPDPKYPDPKYPDPKYPDPKNPDLPRPKVPISEKDRELLEEKLRSHEIREVPPPDDLAAHAHASLRDRILTHTERGRGPHACVCHWLMHEPVDCSKPPLCEWRGYLIDPSDGVPLACVTLERTSDECRPIEIDVVDPCGPRRFVKNNDLLYDFIRGCDLSHISWVSWHFWHRHPTAMPWKLFAALFDKVADVAEGEEPPPVKTMFVVRFSAPVIKDTILFDSVAMRVATIEQSTDWRLVRRVPIVKLDLSPYGSTALPPGTTNQLQIFVDPDWVRDEIASHSSSWLTWDVFEVEIEVYGDGILDCHHLALDGEALGLEPFPSGNGSPGGTYRSSFRVEPKPSKRGTA